VGPPDSLQQPGKWISVLSILPRGEAVKKSMFKGFFDFLKLPRAEIWLSRMGGTSAGKIDICFYLYCPGAKPQKKEAG